MTNAKRFVSCMVLLTMLAGCTSAPAEDNTNSGYAEEGAPSPVPERLSFSAPTFDRDVDNGAQHDLRHSFDGPVLLLWVAAGCSGCHDWTAMLSEELEAGNISNTTTSTHTPWPLLLPPESTSVIDVETGRMTDVGLYRAFQNPVTPTLQILDQEGRLVWTSKTYWANTTVLEEALNIMETGGL